MPAPLALQGSGDDWRLTLTGDWSLAALPAIEATLNDLPPTLSGVLVCDWSRTSDPGISSTWLLMTRLAAWNSALLAVRHEGGPPHTLPFLAALLTPVDAAGGAATHAEPTVGFVGTIGRWAVRQWWEARAVTGFFGRIVSVFARALSLPRSLRLTSVVRHVYETGITAVPIVSLIAFLISVIVAYLGAQQLSSFGANIYVVDLVAIAVLRELGVMLTSIIIAGRSGSAFAAELGVMQLNEEIAALQAMGLNPVELLVLPRVLGLAIALPLLTIVADAMGLAGGGLLSALDLHISPAQFLGRLHDALAPTTFWAGLIKAPIFAALIGIVGCYRGMQVRDSARELGRLTTLAVVQSIFLVILVDAVFAVLYVKLDF
jgi:phospholipid/cholesterol/gamma-HCH transport system permease protein